MSLSIAIFMSLFAGAILFAIASVVCWLIRRRFAVRSGLRYWALHALPFMAGGGPLALLIVLMVWSNIPDPPNDYRHALGVAPGPEVTDIRSHPEIDSDAAEVYLAFKAPDATVDRLTKGFRPLTPSQATPSNAPVWWRGWTCADREALEAENRRDWDYVLVVRCRADGQTYVFASAIS